MRFGILLLSSILLLAPGPAAGQNGTVGLNAVQIYSEHAPDKRGPAVVVDVMDNTPAAKAGIRNGDFIVGINGTEITGKAGDDSLEKNLTGPPGGSIKLTLWRDSEGRQFEASLTRVPYPLRRNSTSEPFEFYRPANWRPEVDEFPLPWSPELPYRGWEDLVFAPGFDDKASPNYHAYAFVWWLEGKQEFSTERLHDDLLRYYKGISAQRGRTRKFTPDLERVSVKVSAGSPEPKTAARSFHGDAVFYNPAGELFTLHLDASLRFCGNHTAGVFTLSPKERGAPIWKELQSIEDSFRCGR